VCFYHALSSLMILVIEVVIGIELELSFALSAGLSDLLCELNYALSLHCSIRLVVDISVVYVGLIIGIDAIHGPLILGLLGVVGEELAREERGDDAHGDRVTVVH
jgi:hypothetical protein